MSFAHLNVKSNASMLYASCKVKDVVARAKELGQTSIALTDYSNVFNAIPFYREATSQGIKPILGCDFFFVEDAAEYRRNKNRSSYHITLLAENDRGWQNITRLLSAANDEDYFFYRPRIDFDLLEQHSEGVIVLTGGSDGIMGNFLYDHQGDDGSISQPVATFRAEALLRKLMRTFDSDHLYLEVQNNGLEHQKQINENLRAIAKKRGLQTIATNNVHYVGRGDAEAHRTLLIMASNQFNKMTYTDFSEEGYYIKSEDEMDGFTDDEIGLTGQIAERCNVTIDLKKRRLPKYQFVPDNRTSEGYLRHLAEEGMKRRGLISKSNLRDYQDRLERELGDIHEMGFDDYFLIVHDVCSWVRQQDILLGKGRGSAGGSLVSYCLGITDIDPLPYGLVWERFLNKGRGGLPDIDTDVPKSRRQEVLGYIRERFGEGNVAQLVTFNALGARSVLKEVFRAYEMPFEEANRITSFVPLKNDDHQAVTLEEALSMSPELREYEKKHKAWFAIAKALEGCYKSIGMHAAAVVISDTPFHESSYPLCRTKGGDLIFAYDMGAVDALSLLKLDILGLTTLDDVSECIDIVRERTGKTVDREELPLDDMNTYAIFHQGRTGGIFQLEKQLGKTWSKATKPSTIDELSDLVSIIRPGPLECLSGNTRILTHFWDYRGRGGRRCYRYKTIKELYEDFSALKTGNKRYSDKIISINEEDFSYHKNRILDVVKSGVKLVYDVKVTCRLDGVYSKSNPGQRKTLHVEATQNHRFLTHAGGWKRLSELKSGDYIAITNRGYGVSRPTDDEYIHGRKNFRNIAFNNYPYECCMCDWDEGSLDVNHIEGNRLSNNTPDNLCFMCPNHHRMFTEGNIDKEDLIRAKDRYRLPFTDDVIFVRFEEAIPLEEVETYDICVEGPWHNFVAGDFIVHNSGMAQDYVAVKFGNREARYLDPALEPILKDTYSGCLYQEQVIFICQKLAGMSLIDADKVRKAMGKKKPEEMAKWRQAFVDGCNNASNINEDVSGEIWGFIEKFAGYGFNKAHGVGYGLLAYETAYFKANYTTEFFCAKLRNSKHSPDSLDEVNKLINDGKLFDVIVTPPNFRSRNVDFDIVDDGVIAFGLSSLKGVGDKMLGPILSMEANSFEEFIGGARKKNKTAVEGLIKSGALDCFDLPRVEMLAQYRLMKALSEREWNLCLDLGKKNEVDFTRVLAGLSDEDKVEKIKKKYEVKVPNVRRREKIRELLVKYRSTDIYDSLPQKISWEKEILGIPLSGNLADAYVADNTCKQVASMSDGDRVQITMTLGKIRKTVTKRGKNPGQEMAFIEGGDHTYFLDNIVVFPRQWSQCCHNIEEGVVVKIIGEINDRGGIIANRVERLR
jgi:DNA polymerase III alpha subunit